MKKFLLVPIFVCFASLQYVKAQEVDFGLQFGGGVAFYKEKKIYDSLKLDFSKNGLWSLTTGPFFNINFHDYYIGFSSGLHYNLFAFDIETKKNGKKENYNLYYHFIKTPILLKFIPLDKLSLYIGPEFYFFLKNSKSSNEGIDKPNQDFKNYILGLLISMKFEFKNIIFGLDFTTTLSSLDTYKNDTEMKKSEEEFKKSEKLYKKETLTSLSFKIGYNFAKLLK